MRAPTSSAAVTLATIALAAACTDEAPSPTEAESFTLPVYSAPAARSVNFRTHARGGEEVPPVNTRAQGQATFNLSADGEALHYKLIVANIVDVRMAHIHLAPAGENGGIVVWLYPSTGQAPELIPGRSQGVLEDGDITADDLVGALAGGSMDDLIEVLRDGNGYVNVHTVENPGGEVRGQIH